MSGRDRHGETIDRYEEGALRWERLRSSSAAQTGADAATFATAHELLDGPEGRLGGPRRAPDAADAGAARGAVVDLGCGPGWHLEGLGPAVVGLDASSAMLELARRRARRAPVVQADLRALPLRRGAAVAAWASRSYVHLRREAVPLALWDLHRSLRVGAPLRLVVFEGDLEHGTIGDDDLPGRWFSAWPEELLEAVVEGAGFSITGLERRPDGTVTQLHLDLRRERTLADTVGSDMRLLLVGLNPSLVAAEVGVGFHRSGNRAWPALEAAGLASKDRDPRHLLVHDRIGMTDLVKRATPRADSLSSAEYRHGLGRLERLCDWLRPDAVCVVGLSGWRAAVDRSASCGPQQEALGGRPVYVMPNTSGVNTHHGLDDLTEHLRAAAGLADRSAARR